MAPKWEKCDSEIQRFYSGKSIFLTGGTGFVGKFVIEKLLRSCSDLEAIYILVRQKKGKDINTRLQEIYDSSLFERLKQECPNFKEKLIPVAGDLNLPDLGISDKDRKLLSEKVNVIFHSAATVKFDEHLRVAMATNTQAPLELLAMTKEFKHLEVMIHVSTAYSNCNEPLIEEKIYKSDIDYESFRESVAKLTDAQIDEMLPLLLGTWPNTYAFTKAMAERELTKQRGNVPLAFFRPSIVVSSYKEPVPGWVDNLTAATGMTVGGGSGVIHALHCDSKQIVDLVPVDYVANGLIATSVEVQNMYKHTFPEEPPVFNYVSAVEKPETFGHFFQSNGKRISLYPFPEPLWYFSMYLIPYGSVASVMKFFLHTVPAAFMDLLATATGSKARLGKIYEKTEKYLVALNYFITRSFYFSNERTQAVWEKLSEEDKKTFPFSMKTLEWEDFYELYLLGIRRYYFKVGDETLPRDRKQFQRLKYMHLTLKYTTVAIFTYCLWRLLSNLSFEIVI